MGADKTRAMSGVQELPPLPMEAGPKSFLTPRVGQPGRYKWTMAAVWLIYLIGPVYQVGHADRSFGWKLLNYVIVATFVVLYMAMSFAAFPRTGRIGSPVRATRAAWPLVGSMALLATVGSLFVNVDLLGLWIYVGSASGLSLPLARAQAQKAVLGAVAGVTLCAVLGHAKPADLVILLFPTFFAGLTTIGIRQMAALIAELREAREQVARLAANEERLRLARDLHDLTGHSLSMITLKAQLAQRMLARAKDAAPRDAGPAPRLDSALTEMTEIEQVSRQSLADIREAVSGYRRPTIAVELASAYAALDAAGIKLDADAGMAQLSGMYDPEAEAALAWSLREAVTNAIRHSGATRVRVSLREAGGELVLTVRNDGSGLATAVGGATGAHGGNGLPGLRERLDAVDGRLAIGGPDGDFKLVAAVPLRAVDGDQR